MGQLATLSARLPAQTVLKKSQHMKERIRQILEDALPLADLDSDFLFAELSSLDITTIMMLLSEEYHIMLDSVDVTPRNFMSLDAITAMVKEKMDNA